MFGTRRSRLTRARALLFVLAAFLLSGTAHAYPWMIRHHYSACSTCHYDPSGAGAITAYGRAVADAVLRTGGESGQEDVPPSARFLFGAVPTPDWLELGGDVRLLQLASKTDGV